MPVEAFVGLDVGRASPRSRRRGVGSQAGSKGGSSGQRRRRRRTPVIITTRGRRGSRARRGGREARRAPGFPAAAGGEGVPRRRDVVRRRRPPRRRPPSPPRRPRSRTRSSTSSAGTMPSATAASTPCATPACAAPQVSAAWRSSRTSALFTKSVAGFTGRFGPQDDDERDVALPRRRESGRPGGLHRAALAPEHGVHVGRVRARFRRSPRRSGCAATKLRSAITPRATSPAFMAAKASLISSSANLRETSASRSSRPSM